MVPGSGQPRLCQDLRRPVARASRLPRAHLHVLPGAAHMTSFTDPAALAQLILRAADR